MRRAPVAFAVLVAACHPVATSSSEIAGGSCATMTCNDGARCVENYRSSGHVYAACALGGDVDPRCQRDEDIAFCDGNDWVRCIGRYRVEAIGCGDERCAEALGTARCVRTGEADPSCDATAHESSYCDGDAVVSCFGPYANESDDCTKTARFCRAGACVVDPNPDVRCAGRPDGNPNQSYCDGDVAVQCVRGFRREVHDCARVNMRCADLGTSVECRE